MKTHIVSFVCIVLGFFVPAVLHAEVVINEIAWMGTVVSANDEWIELYNNGTEDVDVTGWKLSASDGDPSITLSGSISAGAYYLLERTDDESVPDISADVVYSGGIANTGETFTLYDAMQTVMDTVSGGTDWKTIGGSNTTKDTPQRQLDATWITGTPTPKGENSTVDNGTGTSGGGSSSGTTGNTVSKPKLTGGYKQIVFAYAGEDSVVPAGARTTFEGYAVNDRNESLSAAHYEWSFGDGGKKKGAEVSHVYKEPGVYVVTLSISADNQRSHDQKIVRVVAADVYISEINIEKEYIEITNNTNELFDLSEWKLFMEKRRSRGDRTFSFPDHTFIAPNTAVKFSSYTTNLHFGAGDTMYLLYPDENMHTKLSADM